MQRKKLVHKPISNANISKVFAKLIVFYSKIHSIAEFCAHTHTPTFIIVHLEFGHDDDKNSKKKIAARIHNLNVTKLTTNIFFRYVRFILIDVLQ